MSDKIIVLPDREEMLRRLVAVCDNSHMQQKFYPILLKSAGNELFAEGVVMKFTLAIYDYCQGMPPLVDRLVYMYVPRFIDALVDDKGTAQKAKDFLEQALKG